MEVVFQHSFYLWALLIIPFVIIIHFISLKYSKKRAIKFANFIALARVSEKMGISSNFLVLFLRVLVFAFIILAITGTSLWFEGNRLEADYVIAIDSSSSMLAEDLDPNRLDVAKQTASTFVENLNYFYSSAAIVSFSGTPLVHQVLTKDKASLKQAIENIEIMTMGGTDIGNAIVSSSNILLGSNNPKVIILITDGRDNIGIDYLEAISYANNYNIMIFTIGIGGEEGYAAGESDMIGPLGIDEEQLTSIAHLTGGDYYSVLSTQDFENTYVGIVSNEKRKVSLDLTFIFLILILFLLVLEWILINTRFRIIP